MDCKKCPYFDNRREIAAGKVLVGFCKLRGKYMSDTTRGKEQCKDRATFDMPANTKATPIKPEPPFFTEKEKAQLGKARAKPVERSPSSPTLADMATKPSPAPVARERKPTLGTAPTPKAGVLSGKEIPTLMKPQDGKPITEKPAQIIPPMKLTPEDAMKLLDQQLSGKINAKFSKYGTKENNSEKEVIRKAVWGGGT